MEVSGEEGGFGDWNNHQNVRCRLGMLAPRMYPAVCFLGHSTSFGHLTGY